MEDEKIVLKVGKNETFEKTMHVEKKREFWKDSIFGRGIIVCTIKGLEESTSYIENLKMVSTCWPQGNSEACQGTIRKKNKYFSVQQMVGMAFCAINISCAVIKHNFIIGK